MWIAGAARPPTHRHNGTSRVQTHRTEPAIVARGLREHRPEPAASRAKDRVRRRMGVRGRWLKRLPTRRVESRLWTAAAESDRHLRVVPGLGQFLSGRSIATRDLGITVAGCAHVRSPGDPLSGVEPERGALRVGLRATEVIPGTGFGPCSSPTWTLLVRLGVIPWTLLVVQISRKQIAF
jgi:hypothetical protein